MNKIQPADPKTRKIVLVLLCITALFGISSIGLVQHHLNHISTWLSTHVEQAPRYSIWISLIALLVMSPVIAVGIHMFVLAKRIVTSERFPPPNTNLLRDTRILTGPAAIQRGRLLKILSLLLIMAALTIPCLIWKLMHTFA